VTNGIKKVIISSSLCICYMSFTWHVLVFLHNEELPVAASAFLYCCYAEAFHLVELRNLLVAEVSFCCWSALGFLGEEGTSYWRKNWSSKWPNFWLDLCVYHNHVVVTWYSCMIWNYTNVFFAFAVWAFDTETECWSLVEAKGDIPVPSQTI